MLLRAMGPILRQGDAVALHAGGRAILAAQADSYASRIDRFDYEPGHDLHYFRDRATFEALDGTLILSSAILQQDGYWDSHDNPGDMIYHYHEFYFLDGAVVQHTGCRLPVATPETGRARSPQFVHVLPLCAVFRAQPWAVAGPYRRLPARCAARPRRGCRHAGHAPHHAVLSAGGARGGQ